ncbi:MAG: SIS domain-containing protein, partial [Persicimonas sp.]
MTEWHMRREIDEQPDLLESRAAHWMAEASRLGGELLSRDNLVVLGRGSSGNACVYASYLYALRTGRHAIELRPWVTTQQTPEADWSDASVLAFSVSGQSTDIAHAAAWLKERGAHVVGVTNAEDDECRLGHASHGLCHLNVGEERAVPSTKTLCAQFFASAALLGYDITEPAEETAAALRALDAHDYAEMLAEFAVGARTLSWVGRGPGLAAALDAALKCRESARQNSDAWSTAEFQHGFIGSLSADDRVVVFSDGNDTAGNIVAVTNALLSRKTPFIVAGASHHPTSEGARPSSVM